MNKQNNYFIKENLNPLNKKVGDCVVRSISKALNKDWYTTLKELYELGLSIGCLPNDKLTYTEYLKKYPSINVFYSIGDKKKRYSVKDLCIKYPNNTLIIRLAGHLTTIKKGYLYDIWDCSNKKAYKIWLIGGNNG